MQLRMSGKITRMVWDMENTEISHVLEIPGTLTERVEEAFVVFRYHAGEGNENGQG